MNAIERLRKLLILQDHYTQFEVFLEDAMEYLGFKLTPLQADIGKFLQYSSGDIGIQAQRSQAKTTITACYGVWSLIQNPKEIILIISAGETQATEISTLITKMILNWEIIECLKPDRTQGDRTSVEAFDVHHSLKGINKSPSVACVGVNANLQGKRASLLIADDVESQKNSRTEAMREVIRQAVKDFSSIVQTGRIIFLGTPQNKHSLYNELPARGVQMRIWTGRYPTPEQLKTYGRLLAPYILNKLLLDASLGSGGGANGKQGKPTDPHLLNEEALQTKEDRQGTAFFQLQHMLSTALVDANRYPLKSEHLVVLNFTDSVPLVIKRGVTPSSQAMYEIGGIKVTPYWPHYTSEELTPLPKGVFYIDPAGGGKNADETGYAHVSEANAYVFVKSVGGVRGGYSRPVLESFAELIKKADPELIVIEKNFGYGAFMEVFAPILRDKGITCGITDEYVTGQKEKRIIDILEPIMGRGSVVFHESIFKTDWDSTQEYSLEQRKFYTLAYQLSSITYDPKACVHDDRLDALAGAVGYYIERLMQLDKKAITTLHEKAHLEWLKNPRGKPDYAIPKRSNSINARSRQ